MMLLALFADSGGEDKIGRSFDLRNRFDVKKGEIYLEYEVI
jgi:hypothetical protein